MSDKPDQQPLPLESPETQPKAEYLSRSALAEKLDLPLKTLTQMMMDAGWLQHHNKQWILTEKGKFEGGQYRQSQKFGQYIVWPATIVEHAVLRDSDKQLLSATTIGREFDIPPRLFNRLLKDLGWLQPYALGWQVTPQGTALGGQQQKDEETGVPYVLWAKSTLDHPDFVRAIHQCCMHSGFTTTLDGRDNVAKHHVLICHWLYLLSITFAYQKPVSQTGFSTDFYLPDHQLFIEHWGEGLDPSALTLQFQKREYYQRSGIPFIEVDGHDFSTIDRDLTKAMLGFGIDVYG